MTSIYECQTMDGFVQVRVKYNCNPCNTPAYTPVYQKEHLQLCRTPESKQKGSVFHMYSFRIKSISTNHWAHATKLLRNIHANNKNPNHQTERIAPKRESELELERVTLQLL